ncbi:MAG: M1 family metallopeptidase [Blastocatellia bacterium]|nr:M1 family metallopeptidase [Blastocatellia bacterium]
MMKSSLRKWTWPLLVVAMACGTAWADEAPQPLASYKIDVRLQLDEKGHPSRLEGVERLTWLNDSPDAIGELQFHLYLNAFKNEKSTFFRESGGQLRGERFAPGEWGWIDIREMRLVSGAGGEDLTGRIEFIHPDDDNADDQTVIRVPLSKPIRPGEKISLDIRFAARLPRVFARTGYWGPFAMVAQWFPKIGVWEQAGERRRAQSGWNCHQFHSSTEFYADFGNYDVTMTVPASYRGRLGATGMMRSETVRPDGAVAYNFTQENVHDFAWTLDTSYLVVKRMFKADEQLAQREIDEWAARLRLPAELIRLRDVEVTLLIQNEHRGQIDRHFAAAFNAIKYYGLWYGPYPYDTLTVVDPPYNGDGAGGMEYPTLITAGTTWWPGRDQNPEAVIVHEFGHQFWYGLVATNEFEESWMDEGFNTYSEKRVLKTAYGADSLPFRALGLPLFDLPIEITHPYLDRVMTLREPISDPVLTPAWKYYDFMSYGINSYPRPGLVLATLERYLGEDAMARVMRAYHQRWRYRHPTSQDFFDVAGEIAGQDLSWYFDQFVRGTQTLDYEIAEVKSEPSHALTGLYDKDGAKVEIERPKNEAASAASRANEIVVRRIGEAWFPIEMEFRLKGGGSVTARPVGVKDGVIEYRLTDDRDGGVWTESWAIRDRWKKFRFTSSSEVVAALLDPDRKLLLEANWTNNSRTQATGIGAGLRWSTGAMFWLQTLLQFASALS